MALQHPRPLQVQERGQERQGAGRNQKVIGKERAQARGAILSGY